MPWLNYSNAFSGTNPFVLMVMLVGRREVVDAPYCEDGVPSFLVLRGSHRMESGLVARLLLVLLEVLAEI